MGRERPANKGCCDVAVVGGGGCAGKGRCYGVERRHSAQGAGLGAARAGGRGRGRQPWVVVGEKGARRMQGGLPGLYQRGGALQRGVHAPPTPTERPWGPLPAVLSSPPLRPCPSPPPLPPPPPPPHQASYALGYNLAIEYLADYEKTWMLDR